MDPTQESQARPRCVRLRGSTVVRVLSLFEVFEDLQVAVESFT